MSVPPVRFIAPPFAVIDVSLKQQPFKKGQGQEFLPDYVVAEQVELLAPAPVDLFSPSFLAEKGATESEAITRFAPRLHGFFETFPPVGVRTGGTLLKYTTVAISAPDNPFPKMDGWPINGRIGFEFYHQLFDPNWNYQGRPQTLRLS